MVRVASGNDWEVLMSVSVRCLMKAFMIAQEMDIILMTLAKTKSCSKIRFRTDAFAFLRAGDGSTPTEADTYGLTDRLQR